MKIQSLCLLAIVMASCGSSTTSGDDPVAIATKRIRQRIDADAWGTMEKFEVFDVEAKGDSVYQATHTFENIIGKEMKITRLYTLNAGLDSVIEHNNVATFMKSEGEWVKSPF